MKTAAVALAAVSLAAAAAVAEDAITEHHAKIVNLRAQGVADQATPKAGYIASETGLAKEASKERSAAAAREAEPAAAE